MYTSEYIKLMEEQNTCTTSQLYKPEFTFKV